MVFFEESLKEYYWGLLVLQKKPTGYNRKSVNKIWICRQRKKNLNLKNEPEYWNINLLRKIKMWNSWIFSGFFEAFVCWESQKYQIDWWSLFFVNSSFQTDVGLSEKNSSPWVASLCIILSLFLLFYKLCVKKSSLGLNSKGSETL